MKVIISVFDKPFEGEPVEVIEFTGTREELNKLVEDWANTKERVIFDMEIIEDGQMSAVYGLTTERK